jgi:hypothetical protein
VTQVENNWSTWWEKGQILHTAFDKDKILAKGSNPHLNNCTSSLAVLKLNIGDYRLTGTELFIKNRSINFHL